MKKGPVMLIPQKREKHLLFLVENKQKQIPRFARDDMGASCQPEAPARHPRSS
jgi:hypothetical protein